MGPFDKMFDYNGDGKLNTWEKAAELSFLDHISALDDVDGTEDAEFYDEEDEDDE